jgi:hypothetical protein
MKFEGPLFKKGKESEFQLKERYFIYHENNLVSFKVRNKSLISDNLYIIELPRHRREGHTKY